ncbi:hypothetical protein F4778DRAFT_42600 [Xylariomycetidae sp. FL2044]|nr:hypothetical protein F4778DRAFT_42600 [Xylariomycetidae sp. FL2044]
MTGQSFGSGALTSISRLKQAFGILRSKHAYSVRRGPFFQTRAMGSIPRTITDGNGPLFKVKRIAIIGAGPCGMAAAKYLVAQEAFDRIDVFEQQAEVGGVWKYSAHPSHRLQVPQTSAFAAPDPPAGEEKTPSGTEAPVFPSPMYEDLHTNIPHTLMRYSDQPFPPGCEIFPSREVVQDYLVAYSRDIRHLIQFSTSVESVVLRSPDTDGGSESSRPERDQWEITTRSLTGDERGGRRKETYDAVVVASGHYSTPYIPAIPGIEAFNEAHPGVISHSKLYRDPDAYRGKKVLLVGNGPSGLDIAAQIRRVCREPLLVSAQTRASPEALQHVDCVEVGEIEKFLVDEKGVVLKDIDEEDDGSSRGRRIEKDIDAILFCTGYLYSFPFLDAEVLRGSDSTTGEVVAPPLLTDDGRRVHGLARHLLHIRHPTLAFPGLPYKIIPFPVSEAQAAVLARLWADELPLPPREVLERWEKEDGEGRPAGKYHVFGKGEDGRYINWMHDWALGIADRADGKTGDERGAEGAGKREGEGRGKAPPFWGPEEVWQRSIYAQAKMEFEKTGRKAKTLEELGFEYEPPADEKEEGEGERDFENNDERLDMAG